MTNYYNDQEIKSILRKLTRINTKYRKFWKWYDEQAKLEREGTFFAPSFMLQINAFFSFNGGFEPNTLDLEPKFLRNLHDAVMCRHQMLERLIIWLRKW